DLDRDPDATVAGAGARRRPGTQRTNATHPRPAQRTGTPAARGRPPPRSRHTPPFTRNLAPPRGARAAVFTASIGGRAYRR
uniref:hypothetical protein n=1 Tax=Nocardia abscessus TaxID=120957 RepID=UPI0024581579